MNLHKTAIEWATHTWNPVTGCRHGCEYCYARRFTARFAPHACERPDPAPLEFLPKGTGIYVADTPARLLDEHGAYLRSTPYPKGFAPTFHTYTLGYPEKCLTPARIFVSSMGDLFGEWVPDAWISEVFDACKIGWEAEGYDDRPARPVPGRYTRSSPPWCPRRKERNST